mgnify:CR=1 FL=1
MLIEKTLKEALADYIKGKPVTVLWTKEDGSSVIVGHPGTGRKSFSGKRSGISQSGICTGSS